MFQSVQRCHDCTDACWVTTLALMEALRRADPGSGQCQLIRGWFVPLFGISTASLQRVGAAADAVPLCGQTGGGGDAAFIHPPLHFL